MNFRPSGAFSLWGNVKHVRNALLATLRARGASTHGPAAPPADAATQHRAAERAHMRACMESFEARVAMAASAPEATFEDILAVIRAGEGLDDVLQGSSNATPSRLLARGVRVATSTLARRAARGDAPDGPPGVALGAPAGLRPGQLTRAAFDVLEGALKEKVLEYGTGQSQRMVHIDDCQGSIIDVLTMQARGPRPSFALDTHMRLQRILVTEVRERLRSKRRIEAAHTARGSAMDLTDKTHNENWQKLKVRHIRMFKTFV